MTTQNPLIQTSSTGLVVAIIGFFSSFPIVLQGLAGVGATTAEAASGLMFAAIAMGVAGIALSLWQKMPISVAWSTPGVALLAVGQVPDAGFAGGIAAFIIAGTLTVVAGIFKPIGRLAASVPVPLAQAMLAGVLATLCVAPFQALAVTPQTTLPVILTWFIVGRSSRIFAVPAAVVAAIFVTAVAGSPVSMPEHLITQPLIIAPVFSWNVTLGIAVPLFIVTMATQNVPGIAILRSFGYTPAPGPLFAGVGAASVLSAPMGAPATCLAAITAAMCAGEDAHPDKQHRYFAAIIAGVFYCLFGLFAGVIIAVATAAPQMLMATLAGIALLSVFANATAAALENPDYRDASAITFLTTASGMTLFGLGAAVWGLIFGGLVLAASRAIKSA